MKLLICALVFSWGTPVYVAQETKQSESKRGRLAGFEWLRQFKGSWATAYNGTMKTRLVGNRWIVSEISFQKGVSAVQIIGYDKKKKQFVGTWIDSTASYIWQYVGSLDSTGKVLTLEAQGPDMTAPTKTMRYRDIYEFKSKNEIAAVSQMLNDKGEWTTFNRGKMTRKVK